MFLVMFILISWFAHNHLIAGCKRELPPTKQEISIPYISKVTDILFEHYGLYAYFFRYFFNV